MSCRHEAKELAGNILTTKSIQLQTEYMGTRRMIITVYGVPLDITVDHVKAFFANFGQVRDIIHILSKVGVPTGDFKSSSRINRSLRSSNCRSRKKRFSQ